MRDTVVYRNKALIQPFFGILCGHSYNGSSLLILKKRDDGI